MVEVHGGVLFWSVVTFLLLLVVLKKVAWGPILSALESREEEIKNALSASEKAKEEAEKVSSDYEQSMKDAKIKAQKKEFALHDEFTRELKSQSAIFNSDSVIFLIKEPIITFKLRPIFIQLFGNVTEK